jgi:hypothetical protein
VPSELRKDTPSMKLRKITSAKTESFPAVPAENRKSRLGRRKKCRGRLFFSRRFAGEPITSTIRLSSVKCSIPNCQTSPACNLYCSRTSLGWRDRLYYKSIMTHVYTLFADGYFCVLGTFGVKRSRLTRCRNNLADARSELRGVAPRRLQLSGCVRAWFVAP